MKKIIEIPTGKGKIPEYAKIPNIESEQNQGKGCAVYLLACGVAFVFWVVLGVVMLLVK